jgi:hypothetical protein
MEGIDKGTFKRIFEEHWGDFKVVYPRFDTSYYDTVVQKMLNCGDPKKMGFVQYRCFSCLETRRIAFTCKSSFCLSCSHVYSDQWAEFVGRRLFPGVTYRHMVLTMPDGLHPWFYRDPTLLSKLMQTGYACLKDIFRATTGVELDIGLIMVLQTFGRSSHYNPHLHILVTGGGVDPKGKYRAVTYIPYEIMHRKWQYHLLTMLRENVPDPKAQKDIDQAWRKYPKGFVAYLQPGEVPPGGQGLAQYLAKYVVSPPISVRRIEQYDGKTVTYWYRDHLTEAIQHETLPVLRFVGRMVQHILPKGFQRIRYYGLHGNPCYEQARQQLDQILPSDTPVDPKGYRVVARKPFVERFQESFGKDPLLCPRCGHGMHLELIKHPDYGILYDILDSCHERPEPGKRSSRVAEEDARGNALARPKGMGQIPLPFM